MPVEYCTRCKSLRPLQIATSRVRVLLPGHGMSEITTRTCYCSSCRSFVLASGDNHWMETAAESGLPPKMIAPGRRAMKSSGMQRGRT